MSQRWSKGLCRDGMLLGKLVSSTPTGRSHLAQITPHMQTHDLSQHVHRIGFHFPSAVVASVCMDLGFYLTATGKAVPYYTAGETDNQSGASSEVSQVTINTEAREILRDLFPNIPDNDLYQIIKTAFQKVRASRGVIILRLMPCRVREELGPRMNCRSLDVRSWPWWRTFGIFTLTMTVS